MPHRAKRTQKLPFASELACVLAPYLKPPSRVTYFRELDLKFEADKQKALAGILAEVIRTRNPYLLSNYCVPNNSNAVRSALVCSPPSPP